MTKEQYVYFQTFKFEEEAKNIASILKDNGISVLIENVSPPVDITFSLNHLQDEYKLKLKQEDFDKANEVLMELATTSNEEIPPGHYLHEFTFEELMEILQKPDEWSKEDYILAQKILKLKGYKINDEEINDLRKRRYKELDKPEKGHIGWLVFGFISAILGGLLGIFIGWFHYSYKKTTHDGKKIYAYEETTRKKGKVILLIGLVSFILWITGRILEFI